jgi:hypothetical protein
MSRNIIFVIKVTVLWDMTQCSLVDTYANLSDEPVASVFRVEGGRYFCNLIEGTYCRTKELLVCPDNCHNSFLRNVGKYIPNCTASLQKAVISKSDNYSQQVF